MREMTVEGDQLTAVVDLDRGGKIVSLTDAAGREWLAQRHPDAGVGPGKPFVLAEMSGWDECAPTIVACDIDGCALPDHGDIWDAPVQLADDGITIVATGSALPYELRRTIRPTAHGLILDYSATTSEDALPFLWAAHPQFAAPTGTRVEVPGVDRVVDVLADPPIEVPWTNELATIDTVPVEGCRKVYPVPEASVATARLLRPEYPELVVSWSNACPYVGLWFDAGAFSHEAVIAIEPSTSFYDDLSLARSQGRTPVITPDNPLRWWVRLEVLPERPAVPRSHVHAPRPVER